MKPDSDFELNWLGVDFDDVIAHNTGYPDFTPLEPLKGTQEALSLLHDRGWKIKIYTARPWSDHRMIERYLKQHNIYFDDVVCGKMLVKWMIDDRNISFNGDWTEAIKKVV